MSLNIHKIFLLSNRVLQEYLAAMEQMGKRLLTVPYVIVSTFWSHDRNLTQISICQQGKIGRIGAPGCKGDPGDKVWVFTLDFEIRISSYCSSLTGDCVFHRVLMVILEMLEILVFQGLLERRYLDNLIQKRYISILMRLVGLSCHAFFVLRVIQVVQEDQVHLARMETLDLKWVFKT